MKNNATFVYSPELLTYKFNQHHPFNQKRLELTVDLLKSIQALSDEQIVPLRKASDDELQLIHDEDFIEAVKRAGRQELPMDRANNFGLGTEDTPIFPNMHEASSLIVGGTITAVDSVMEGKSDHALHLGGGLHHGFRGRASGFCIYNDCSIAIAYLRQKYNVRVLYIDTDAHHGDGVQWAFYDDPDVCTLSIHETGRYLFPGTGQVHERGTGQGYGFTFNIPLDAFTEDESWLHAYKTSVEKVVEYFQPDIIVSQNGADAHYYDPLTHLSASIKIYQEIPKLAHEIAHKYCDGKWIAVGGGGYDIWRVVPRAWSFIWLEMTNQRDKATGKLPEDWLEKWTAQSPVPLPTEWMDPVDMVPVIPRKKEIEEKNAQVVAMALKIIQNSKL